MVYDIFSPKQLRSEKDKNKAWTLCHKINRR